MDPSTSGLQQQPAFQARAELDGALDAASCPAQAAVPQLAPGQSELQHHPEENRKKQQEQQPQQEDVGRVAAAALPSDICVGPDVAAAAPVDPVNDPDQDTEFDPELAAWLARTLQRLQPGAELTVGSVKVLGRLLDEITVRVLDEAHRLTSGSGTCSGSCAVGEACDMSTAAVPAAREPEAAAAAAGPAAMAMQERQGRQPLATSQQQQQQQQQHKLTTLTSLDIHKALKRVLPGEPSTNKLRPYLPAAIKQAWHEDKQSLKGIKRQKQAAAVTAAPDACDGGGGGGGGGNGRSSGSGSKENEQQQQQQQQVTPAAATAAATVVAAAAAATAGQGHREPL